MLGFTSQKLDLQISNTFTKVVLYGHKNVVFNLKIQMVQGSSFVCQFSKKIELNRMNVAMLIRKILCQSLTLRRDRGGGK